MPTSYGDLIPDMPPSLRWTDDGHLLASVADRGRAHPTGFGLDGSVERLTEGDVVATDVQSAGDRVVALANVGPEPADLYELRPGKEPRRVTREGARWFGPFRRQVETVSPFDRRKGSVEAWMLRGGRGRRPTVLHVHGGPYASHAPVPWLEMLALAGAGFHVVWANPSDPRRTGKRSRKTWTVAGEYLTHGNGCVWSTAWRHRASRIAIASGCLACPTAGSRRSGWRVTTRTASERWSRRIPSPT